MKYKDFISEKKYQRWDIFYYMRTSKTLWTGKYYIERQRILREITKHYAIVCKLKGLTVYKAYHTSNDLKDSGILKKIS